MLKLILLSILGKEIVSSRVFFNSVKSYLVLYMMLLPAFMQANANRGDSNAAGAFSSLSEGLVLSFNLDSESFSFDAFSFSSPYAPAFGGFSCLPAKPVFNCGRLPGVVLPADAQGAVSGLFLVPAYSSNLKEFRK